MKFNIATLLLMVVPFAIAFAFVQLTNDATCAFIVLTSTTVIVAMKTTGRLRLFALAYSVFSFAMLFVRPVPNVVTDWVWNNVHSDRPFKTVGDAVANIDNEMATDDLLQAASRIFLSVMVATIFAWSIRPIAKAGVTMRSTEVAGDAN
ncbi:MAG: hypothetical protein HKN47_20850 [Pirellulaceae bacterium]|nr:hypothetical protein [Pirellulaceae bacterium]